MRDFLTAQVYKPGDPPPRRVPGAVLLVDTPAGRFLEAAGMADLASGAPAFADDRFEIGSITKLFTAVALLQLQEEGTLSLDDPLSQWLPDLAAEIPYGQEMTLRQLATHTAGLGEYERDLYPIPQAFTDPAILEKAYAPAELVRWVAENKPPLFPPGAPGQWMYSNAGYVLLGMVLETATGQPLGEIYRERIFDPLGMESALLLEDAPAAGETARGYNAMTGEYIDATGWNPSGAWASGALAMNAGDLARFAQALAGGELFQESQSLAQMTDFVSTGQPRGFTGYGLGLAQLADGTWGHAGGTPGFGAVLLIKPDESVTAVWLGNSGSFNVNPEELNALLDGWLVQ
jgi:D-alanyl-D-alanine carboxypeptidase